MSQLQPRECFLLGYLPPIIGVFFCGLELLLTAERGASAARRARLDEQAQALTAPERRDGVLANVRLAESLLGALGQTPPPPPRTPADFHLYAQQVFTQVSADQPVDSPARAAHLLGFVLGELSLDLNLSMLVNYLLDAEPTSTWLHEQEQALRQSIARGRQRTIQALEHPALSAAVRSAAAVALRAVAEVGEPGASNASDTGRSRTAALARTLRTVSDTVGAIERAIA